MLFHPQGLAVAGSVTHEPNCRIESKHEEKRLYSPDIIPEKQHSKIENNTNIVDTQQLIF